MAHVRRLMAELLVRANLNDGAAHQVQEVAIRKSTEQNVALLVSGNG